MDTAYNGIATSLSEEGIRTANMLDDNEVLILANHGSITVGKTLAVAFDHAYYLERAAMVQVEAMQCNKVVTQIDADTAEMTYQQLTANKEDFAKVHLYAFVKKYKF